MRPDNQSPASSLSAGLPAGQHLPLAVLRQYVAGTLPAAEQHRVEAHTLACTRCADVLEGLAQTDLPTTDRALTDLQARLRARVAEEKPDATPVAPLWPLRQIAAAVLVLLAAAALWLGVRRTTEGPASAPRIAMQQPAATPSAVPPPAPAAASAPEAATEAAGAVAAASVPTDEPTALRRPSPRPPVALRSARRQSAVVVADTDGEIAGVADSGTALGNDAGSKELVVTDSGSVARTVEQAESDAYTLNNNRKLEAEPMAPKAAKKRTVAAAPAAASSRVAPSTKALVGSVTSAMATPAGMRLVRGQVTDQTNGAGLPGVTVLAKGTAIGASTAADGSFALLVPDSVKALTFNSIGYTSSEQQIGALDSTVALALAPDTKQLNEVVVVRRERPPAPMSVGALPAGGYAAFREYLKKNLQYPEKALKDNKEGTVKLRFTVAVDGSVQDIKVVSSLSEECDAEAIRLLKEGPRWYPAISKGRRTARPVEISVPFRVTE
ncbi:TonB family protein [Hymenobacter sp. BT186]|uniref:TonB family protein n=1 Tax=Hymenobacter telluris TaxID=2816474 RepID=A0A939EYW9_9BACT|nr:TonB family protein [Hymenobacter telluris]MBO0360374.1 TonB family protein [Hymenobacter telluris]MBW3376401.1 TonB family protein [Hymenobacter norwichensis]